MLVPIALILLALLAAAAGGLYIAKKRAVDHEGPRGDARPDDRRPTSRPSIS